MTTNEVREKFLSYYKEREHTEIPSSSLVPENDPTTLFTGSGMQPLITYLLGEKHPKGTRLVDSQKCFRAEDIEEVGDNRHTTFFEMLGNWSLGDYFKKEQLPWIFHFLTDELGIDPKRLYVTVFAEDRENNIPTDDESVTIWTNLFKEKGVDAKYAHIGTEAKGYELGMKEGERIFGYTDKNWWSRVGSPKNMPAGEPGGPDSEIFYDFDPSGEMHDTKWGEHCHPNCDCGRFLEISNSVFMEYVRNEDGTFAKLPQQNVDFGGGLERLVAAANNDGDVFNIDTLSAIIKQLEAQSGNAYTDEKFTKSFRVIADHLRAAVFLIADGILPGNKDQQYFVRRLLRRAIRHADIIGFKAGELKTIVPIVVEAYGAHYEALSEKQEQIIGAVADEEAQFRKTLEKGLKKFNEIAIRLNVPVKTVGGKTVKDPDREPTHQKFITGESAFELFTTFGFPIELTVEIAAERGMTVELNAFEKLMKEHKEKSRAGAEQKFKGGLADHSEKTTALHTATHLLLAGLRKELGEHVHQMGSNITEERTRFDFSHDEKVDREILDRVEAYVNDAIQSGAKVTIEQMPKEQAKAEGVEGSFWEKYPDVVNVYTVKDDNGVVYSRELCGGPHVEKMGAISGTFKIKKEESSSAGVRRVKAVLE